jgi:hypothetical protein
MTTALSAPQQAAQTINLKKYGAIAAIAFPILQMVSQGLIQVGGMEPAFAAPAEEILTFFQTRQIAFAPYVFFWLWMIAFGVLLLRRYREAPTPSA